MQNNTHWIISFFCFSLVASPLCFQTANAAADKAADVIISQQPQNQIANRGTPVTFTAKAANALSCHWYQNNVQISDATNETLTLQQVAQASQGYYYAVFTDASISVTTSVARLSVNCEPVITQHPIGQSAPLGSEVSFNVEATENAINNLSNDLSLWLRADAGVVTSMGQVSIWKDQSSNHFDASQSTEFCRPSMTTNSDGMPLVQFNTTFPFVGLSSTAQLSQNHGFTRFLVYRHRNSSSDLEYPFYVGTPQSNAKEAFQIAADQMAYGGTSGTLNSSIFIPKNTLRIWTDRMSATHNWLDFVDATDGDAFTFFRITLYTNTLSSTGPGYYIGQVPLTVTNGFYGDIGEILYFNSVLSESERYQVQYYLQKKYFYHELSPVSYQWFFNTNAIKGETNSTLTLSGIAQSDEGSYYVIVSNSVGTAQSVPAALTVLKNVQITSQPHDLRVISAKQDAVFSVTAENASSYQWYFNDTIISDATNSTLIISNAQPASVGSYYVVVSNSISSETSVTAQLVLDYVPIIYHQPENTTVSYGSNATFSVRVGTDLASLTTASPTLWLKADAGVVTNAAGWVSKWQDQSGNGFDASQTNIYNKPQLTSSFGLGGMPVISFSGTQSTVLGEYLFSESNLNLTDAYTGFVFYMHGDRNFAQENLIFMGATRFSFGGRSFYIAPNCQMAFSAWNEECDSGFTIPPNTYRIWIQGLNTNMDQLSFWDVDSSNTFANTVMPFLLYPPLPNYYVGGLGDDAQNFYGDIAEIILFRGELSQTDRNSVTSYLQQKYYSGFAPQFSCQWKFNGADIPGATNTVLDLQNIQASDAGNYSVTISNSAGFTTSSNAYLTIVPPVVITSQPQSQEATRGNKVTLSVTADNATSYQWYFQQQPILGATNSTYVFTVWAATQEGQYYVVASNQGSAQQSSNAAIRIVQLPAFAKQPVDQNVLTGGTTTFQVFMEDTSLLAANASMALWLKADAGVITNSNGGVSQWKDQSGNNFDAFQTNTPAQPYLTYSQQAHNAPVIHFNGIQSSTGNYLMGTNQIATNTGFTLFTAYRHGNRNNTEDDIFFVGVPGESGKDQALAILNGKLNYLTWVWFSYSFNFSIPAETFRIATLRLGSDLTKLDFFDTDGISDFTNSLNIDFQMPSPGYYIGGLGSNNRNYLGDIAEVIYYQGKLTDEEQCNVENYLKSKYIDGNYSIKFTFQWFHDDIAIDGATNSTLTITNAQSQNSGHYYVTVKSGTSTLTTSNANLGIYNPVIITSQPQNLSLIKNSGTAIFSVSATNATAYQWYHDGIAITAATNSSFTIIQPQPLASGKYWVVASNPVNSQTSTNAILTVIEPPYILNQPIDQTVAEGATVTISPGVISQLYFYLATKPLLWLRADEGVMTNILGKVMEWDDSSVNKFDAKGTSGAYPSLTSDIALSGVPLVHFNGGFNGTANEYLRGSANLSLSNAFTGFVVYRHGNRSVSEEVPFFIGTPNVQNAGRSYLMLRNNMSFSSWGDSYSSDFSIPSNTLRIWTCRLNAMMTQLDFFDTDGSNSFTKTLNVGNFQSPQSQYFVGGVEQRYFYGDIAEIIVYNTNLVESDRKSVEKYLVDKYYTAHLSIGDFSCQWQRNGVNMEGATNSGLVLTNVQISDSAFYSVILSNAAGITVSSNATLTVLPAVSIINQPIDLSVTLGSSGGFSVIATNQTGCQWYFNDSAIAGATNSSFSLSSIQQENLGNYFVIVTNSVSTIKSAVVSLYPLTSPILTDQPLSKVVARGSTVSFSAIPSLDFDLIHNGKLALWLKASSGVITNNLGAISQWGDQSGNGFDAFQSDTNSQPYLSYSKVIDQPVIHFNGIQSSGNGQYLKGDADLNADFGYTVFVVYNQTGDFATDECLYYIGTPTENLCGRGVCLRNNVLAYNDGSGVFLSGLTISSNSFHFSSERVNLDQTVVKFADMSIDSETSSSCDIYSFGVPSTDYFIGAMSYYKQNFLGDVAEIIYFNGVLSDSDNFLVKSYLRRKYFKEMEPGTACQWYINNTPIPGATNWTLTLTNLQYSNVGVYHAILENQFGVVTSSNATLTIHEPPTIVLQPKSQTITVYSAATFAVIANNTTGYQWYHNSIEIPGATNASYTVSNVLNGDLGNYYVVAKNSVGEQVSSNATLALNYLPALNTNIPNFFVTLGSSTTLNSDLTLPASISSGTLALWLKADTGVLTNSDGSVTRWQDNSGNNFDAMQATGAFQPLLTNSTLLAGAPVLHFAGSQAATSGNFLSNSCNLGVSNAYTIFFVYNHNEQSSLSGEAAVFIGTPGNNGACRSHHFSLVDQSMEISGWWAPTCNSRILVPFNVFHIWTSYISTNMNQVVFNDSDGNTNISSSWTFFGLVPPVPGYFIGGISGNSEFFSGDIAEVIIFKGQLNDLDRKLVQGYLTYKYYTFSPVIFSYQWQLNGTNILGATNKTLSLINLQNANMGTYSLVTSNVYGVVSNVIANVSPSFLPEITQQPTSQYVTRGDTVIFQASVSSSSAISFQWLYENAIISGATNNTLVLTNINSTNAGSYLFVASNFYGSVTSKVAFLSVKCSGVVIPSMSAISLSTMTVPLQFITLGDENSIQFSLNYDPSLLRFKSVGLTSSGSFLSLNVNTDYTTYGQIGINLVAPKGSLFSPGTNNYLQIQFVCADIPISETTTLGFSETPMPQVSLGITGTVLDSSYFAGSITITEKVLEGDVFPRPDGDEGITMDDWLQEGRFVVGLDSITNATELQRADCAPRSTLGDGMLTISDWVQIGRYAVNLDDWETIGGPSMVSETNNTPTAQNRIIRLLSSSQGVTNTVYVNLDALGDENAVGFSLHYDPASLTFLQATKESGTASACLLINTNLALTGNLGFGMALSPTISFSAGEHPIIKVDFLSLGTAPSNVELADTPVILEVSDIQANAYIPSRFSSSGETNPLPTLNITHTTTNLTLWWTKNAPDFILQTTTSFVTTNWDIVPGGFVTNDSTISITLPLPAENRFYRLKK